MSDSASDITRRTFTANEAAAILGTSTWAVYEAVKKKQIPAIKIGGRVVIPRAAIEQMLAEAAA